MVPPQPARWVSRGGTVWPRSAPAGGAAYVGGALELLAAADRPVIVIGEVAGALHAWPLLLRAAAIEVCARHQHR
jgi:hypothetical protein